MIPNILCRIACLTRGAVNKQDPEELLETIKKAAESPISVLKEIAKSGEIKRTLRVNVSPWGDLCLHEFRWDPRRVALSPFRLSRGERTWNFYDEIRRNNIDVPEPLILIEVKKLLFTTKTYVATRWIKDSIKLDSVASQEETRSFFDLRSILCQSVDAIARLHNSGFIHGDLKWSNILVLNSRTPKIILTDLDALRRSSSVSAQGKDFARFLIVPERYSLSKTTIEYLIERYLLNRDASLSFLEKTIRKHLSYRLGPQRVPVSSRLFQ